ncbi:MAG: hypothetical protein MI700_03605, partial [Balneolales bacterium]|nr:hypothetical protein [Balneolales bacterium]
MKTLFISICLIISLSTVAISQSTIPKEYRGDLSFTARGVLDGNNVETNFRNHGEMARWGDIPWGSWGNFNYINGIGFIMAARVPGERAKWEDYYGVGISDTTLNPVIINYRDFGKRVSPYTGDLWGWNPLNGFHNIDESFPTPAISTNENSWPETWPDR